MIGGSTQDYNSNLLDTTELNLPGITFDFPAMCVGSQQKLTPFPQDILLTSSNDSVAIVNEDNSISAVGVGSCVLYFTHIATSCDLQDVPLTVNDNPLITDYIETLRVGEEYKFKASSSGIWNSLYPNIATVSNNGKVTALEKGSTIIFLSTFDGCQTPPINLTVLEPSSVFQTDENPASKSIPILAWICFVLKVSKLSQNFGCMT